MKRLLPSFYCLQDQIKCSALFQNISKSVVLLLCITVSFILPLSSQNLPAGFSQVLVANGISSPTVMEFAPDGRIFIAQQTGQLRIIKNGALLAQPFISLSVNSSGERGLLGIAFDPAFASNNFIYLYYTLPSGANNRISRFTANGDIVVAGSEVVLLDLDPLSSATNHNGGTMQFGPDGKLYIGIGENANSANAQNLETNLGKIIRINSDGSIPAGNPFTSGSVKRQRIWSYGLRNPYTITFQPGTGRLFINDVGEVTWEEINEATTGGSNYGWPNAEGNSSNTAYKNPVYTYRHGNGSGLGCAITGGTFFNPASTNYPSSYIGKYFYIDYCGNWIDVLTLNGSTGTRAAFASSIAGSPVSIVTGPDGNLYFLSRAASAVYKITYTSSQMPVITSQPQSVSAAQGSAASFSVTATGSAPLNYQWRRNGTNISGAVASTYTIASVTAANAGSYSVVVSNSASTVTSNNATLTVTQPNQLPVATITSPAAGATYAAGTSINFSGSGTDPEDGTLGAAAFTWFVVFHHDVHTHPGPSAPSGVTTGNFAIPNTGETASNVFYRLYLVVTDSQGARDTAYTDIQPRTSSITLNTTPQGLQLTLDGQPVTTPLTVSSVEGMLRTIGAVSPQTLNGNNYTYSNWSQGGPQTQTITTPVNDVNYVSNFGTGQNITLNPVADARVRSGSYAGTNYGTYTALTTCNSTTADKVYQSYLRFDISSLPLNSASVKLRLYGSLYYATDPFITVQLFNVPSVAWGETTITDIRRPSAQTTVLASANVSGTALQYYEWDLTSFINARRSAGATAVSLEVRNLTVTNYNQVNFYSRERTTNKPQLVATVNSSRSMAASLEREKNTGATLQSISFVAYPNPAGEKFNIEYPAQLNGGILKIIDATGRTMMTRKLINLRTETIAAENLKDGMYILSVQKNDKIYYQQLIIKK